MVSYTYKPGYTIEVIPGPTHYTVTLRGEEEDAWGEHDRVPITYSQGYSNDTPTSSGVRETVRKYEMHEADEWLKLDGVPVRLCHGPGIDPDPG